MLGDFPEGARTAFLFPGHLYLYVSPVLFVSRLLLFVQTSSNLETDGHEHE